MPTAQGHAEMSDVCIAGVGLVTPLGYSAWSTFTSLLQGRTTADRLAEMPPDVDLTALARATGGVGFAAHAPIDPAIDIAERAAREALTNAGVEPHSEEAAKVALVLASSKGAILSVIAPRHSTHRAENLFQGPHGFLARHLQQRLGLGDASAPVAACATSLVALDRAARAVERGETDRVIVVAVESALHPIFVNSYRRLGALAPCAPPDVHRARPLDRSRNGFTLCECAAAVVLERRATCTATLRPWGRIVSTCCVAEPFDLIRAPDRFGALERCARQVAANIKEIALVQPHATGTPDNDAAELAAIERALGERAADIPVYASKGALGHGLGAAGLVNVVLGCVCARARRRPPMPWIESPIESPLSLNRDGGPIVRGAHLCVAAGFGGHVAAVCFEPY